MLIRRSDRGMLASWWFTIDWLLLSAVLLMMAAGMIFSLAASPAVAERYDYAPFHFFYRQLLFLAPAIIGMITVSFLPLQRLWQLSFLVFAGGLVLMGLALFIGPEIKGAHRWIELGSFKLQPSEFVKPAFVVAAAWLMAQSSPRFGGMAGAAAWGLFAGFIGLLLIQPDFGQTVLMILVWGVMLLMHGLAWPVIFGLGAVGIAGAVAAYSLLPHVASRVARFLDPEKGDTFQVDTAMRAFENGGLIGTGPGGGSAKRILPDSHTDFIFAVIGEEFGLVICILLIGLIAFITMRVLVHAARMQSPFAVLASTGLIAIFGFQAIINIGVNLSILPAKGMTLPFISYGGSSLLATALTMGLILALCRRRPVDQTKAPRANPLVTANAQAAIG